MFYIERGLLDHSFFEGKFRGRLITWRVSARAEISTRAEIRHVIGPLSA